MLCPEVWNFKAPESSFSSQKLKPNESNHLSTVHSFIYNHLVSVILPDTFKVPESLTEALINDCDYYKLINVKLSEFVASDFINSFVNTGSLYVLSIDSRIDCDNCASITPSGQLILSLNKSSYQSLGLEGAVSHFHAKTGERYSKYNKIEACATMPKHRLVPTLQTLSLRGVGSLVISLSPPIVTKLQYYHDPQKIVTSLYRCLDCLNELLVSHVPYYLYDTMAVEVLHAVKGLIEKTKKTYYPHTNMSAFLTEMNVVVSLTEVVLNSHLKQIDFTEWPKIMRYVLYKNLGKMSGLEVLNLGSCTGGWRTSDYDKYIVEGITGMKHLRSLCLCFDCTDQVIQVIGDNCPTIQCLDVTSSRSVTDRSIPSLLKCTQLRELQLHRTSVTPLGLAQILNGLAKLQDIGRCDEFGNVIKNLHQNSNCGPYGLKKIQARGLSPENLRLLVDMFPKVEFINLFHDEQITDLTILTSLDNLKELKLLSCAFYGDYLKQLLEVRGSNITSLHLEHAEEIDLNVLIDISQFCPRLKSLVLYNCDFMDSLAINPNKLKIQPFQSLEKLFWVVDCARNHLEFILLHAVNILNILTVNAMKNLEELRILYSSDMNMRTVELLLASCTNLKVLSELESWQVVTVDLKLKHFKPGKPNYERTKKCLEQLEQNFIVTWEPPNETVCPSSVAKYFHDRGYETKLCEIKHTTHTLYTVKIPSIEEDNHYDIVEWLGIVALEADLINNGPDCYLSTYETPEPNQEVGQVKFLQWRGLFTANQVVRLYQQLRKLDNPSWLAMYVQGFSDSPIAWKGEEHHFYANGDNGYVFLLNNDGSLISCIQKCSKKRYCNKRKRKSS
ncbi:Ribonuc P 40 domain containing protein [Asbolus verrucosus]|uniref:Ribonuc P 40 domain containing protein n=1 Tax=Asbolus verrucosus TaxID=1661398 RepID=A0A482WB67_ASBVE|nr:Ribonuc P 40 domain containing protein [Asbolus verrucosus]